jgi:hypothetical protein
VLLLPWPGWSISGFSFVWILPMDYVEQEKRDRGRGNRGWYFPPEIVDLVLTKVINPRDLVVLGTIDSLTQSIGDGSLIWCFASNEYLSKKCGIAKCHLSSILSKLVDLGILIRKFKERERSAPKRYLKPAWRRRYRKTEMHPFR